MESFQSFQLLGSMPLTQGVVNYLYIEGIIILEIKLAPSLLLTSLLLDVWNVHL